MRRLRYLGELSQLIGIVDDEAGHAKAQGRADVAVALDADGCGMHQSLGLHCNPSAADQTVDFAVGREIEKKRLAEFSVVMSDECGSGFKA